jgi:kumamolisin
VPDVAANADPITGYLVKNGPNQLAPMGGTSAVAPLWAALIVRLNEAVGSPAAFLNPFLYQNAASEGGFRDITEGNNMSPGTGGYWAGSGWDSCTGWGSPDGETLAKQLKALFAAQSEKQGQTTAVS